MRNGRQEDGWREEDLPDLREALLDGMTDAEIKAVLSALGVRPIAVLVIGHWNKMLALPPELRN